MNTRTLLGNSSSSLVDHLTVDKQNIDPSSFPFERRVEPLCVAQLQDEDLDLDRILRQAQKALAARRKHVDRLLTERRREILRLREDLEILNNDYKTAVRRTATLEQLLQDQRIFSQRDIKAVEQAHNREMAALHAEIDAILSTRSWKLTAPLRSLRTIEYSVFQYWNTIQAIVSARGGLLSTTSAALGVLHRQGVKGLYLRFKASHLAQTTPVTFQHSSDSSNDFVNSVLRRRRDVLLSGWHRAVTDAIRDRTPLSVHGPTLGLSLVTFNSARWLPRFFETLRAQAFPLRRINVVFVDNGSTDDTLQLIEAERDVYGKEFSSFQIHKRPNLGFGAGHDYAIRQCKDEFVLVSNVDVEFHQHTISQTWRAAMVDEGDIASWEVRQCPYEHPKYYDPVTLEPSWSSHACILLRRSAYEEVGGYEQKIFMYGEDVELSYRFRGQGWRLRYLPQISVTHFVDLKDTTLRPNQLAGSTAANILLRHRYGGPNRAAEGEALLDRLVDGEGDSRRCAAFNLAKSKIEEDRRHFTQNHRPIVPAAFPFRDFDYDISRDGHNVGLQSKEPARDLPLVSIITRTWPAP